MTDTALRLEGVAFRYGSNPILSSINLSVGTGETVCIMGASGHGKTTLLKIASQVRGYAPQSGAVWTSGRVAMDFQSPLLLPHLTVGKNIDLAARLTGKMPRVSRNTVLGALGIDSLLDRYPYELSGGQQKRVSLARTLLTPDMTTVVLDEPFTGLDEVAKQHAMEQLSHVLVQLGISCLFSTHSPSDAVLLSDRVLILDGKPATVRHVQPINRMVDISDPSDAYLPQIREMTAKFREFLKNDETG